MERTVSNGMIASLRSIRGVAFDLDGTIWAGPALVPGARELVDWLREAGVRVVFATNSSRQGAAVIAGRLTALGIEAGTADVVAAFDLVGEAILRRHGPARILPMATPDMAELLTACGHEIVPMADWPTARAVVVANDPAFDFGRLRAASRAVAAGASFFAVNLDARFPVGPQEFDPGCGALAEAVAVASGVRPVVIGKPFAPLFEMTLERLGCRAAEAAMVGDNVPSDIIGGRAAGMLTVWFDERGHGETPAEADLRIPTLHDLRQLWQRSRSVSS